MAGSSSSPAPNINVQAENLAQEFRKHAQEFLDVTKKTCQDMFASYDHKFNDLQRGHAQLIEQTRSKTNEANAKLVDLFTKDYEKLRSTLRADFAEVSKHTKSQFEVAKQKFVSTLATVFKNYTNNLTKYTDDANRQLEDFYNNHSQNFENDFESFMKKLQTNYEQAVKKLRELDTVEDASASGSK